MRRLHTNILQTVHPRATYSTLPNYLALLAAVASPRSSTISAQLITVKGNPPKQK